MLRRTQASTPYAIHCCDPALPVPTSDVTIEIVNNQRPVRLPGVVVQEARRGWITLEVPPTEAWEEPLTRIFHPFVATFARTWDVSWSYDHVLANVATTVCHAITRGVKYPG